MELIFIETPDFVKKFDKLADQKEMLSLQDELLKINLNPIAKFCGGCR
jgi:hypothetical protein